MGNFTLWITACSCDLQSSNRLSRDYVPSYICVNDTRRTSA